MGRLGMRCLVAVAEFLLLLCVKALPALDADGLRAGEAQEVLPLPHLMSAPRRVCRHIGPRLTLDHHVDNLSI